MKFDFYKDKQGEWRWRLKAANGRIVADSGEGYKDKADCRRMAMKVVRLQGLPIHSLAEAPSAAKSYGTRV